MVKYWYGWIPLAILATVVLLSLPWLGLIAALVALAPLVWAMFVVPFRVGRALGRRWQNRSRTAERTAPAIPPVTPGGRPTRAAPVPATVSFAILPSRTER